jgi:protein-disulfide isomerase
METENSSKESSSKLLIPGAIIVAGALVAFAVLYVGGGFKNTAAVVQQNNGTQPTIDVKAIPDNDPSLGDPNAPVTIVEFADFQCPFCGRFQQETIPPIVEEYVKSGKVRIVYRDFAFLGVESMDAALASECANEQGKFWEYHDYLFAHQDGENKGAFSRMNLKQFATAVGLDTTQFNSCLDQNKYQAEVQKDITDARALGVSATPTSFVNGSMVVGAVGFSDFRTTIEQELSKSGKN